MSTLSQRVGSLSRSNFELRTWFERDRAWVALYPADDDSNGPIIEYWDDQYHEAVEDGFIDPHDMLGSVIEHAKMLGLL